MGNHPLRNSYRRTVLFSPVWDSQISSLNIKPIHSAIMVQIDCQYKSNSLQPVRGEYCEILKVNFFIVIQVPSRLSS